MLQCVCVRTIGVLLLFIDNAAGCLCQNDIVLLLFIDNAAGCLCQNDRCVVIIHRQCCRMFVSER